MKFNIKKTKIITFSPITSWPIDGETMETVTLTIFLDFKITADGDCSDDIKRCLPLERKSMANLDSILKSKDIPLLTKGFLVKAIVFSCINVRVGPSRRLNAKELMFLTCGAEEDS